MASFMDRVKTAWDLLLDRNSLPVSQDDQRSSIAPSFSSRSQLSYDSASGVLAPLITRIAMDAAAIPLRHVTVDIQDRLLEYKSSELDDRLRIMANIDQSGTAFIQDAVMTMLETGSVALVPIETSTHPGTGSYDILSLRAGSINDWFNRSVEVNVYNERTGEIVQKTLNKNYVAIAYNPLYEVMNSPNSTLKRLIEKLALLDTADNKLYSQQLDLIIQLPYSLKGERRQEEAERRLAQIEDQLYNSKYGIAYIDATEKTTQLNRPVTNALFESVTALTESLHAQLGITANLFSGGASQEELILYNNRTILPILKALTDAMRGSFFTRTAITQGNTVKAIPSIFKMAPLPDVADSADKLTRNEIMTSNEVRSQIGLEPSKEPQADELRNKNLNKSDQGDPNGEPQKPVEAVEPLAEKPKEEQ